MRKLHRNRWAMAAMAMLLLLATSGITVSRMTCLMSGHSVLSLGRADDCCPVEEREGLAFEATCCDMVQAGAEREELLPVAATAPIALPEADAVATWRMPVEQHVTVRWRDGRPPPLVAPERLSLLRVRLI
jgi:hypothetical protein